MTDEMFNEYIIHIKGFVFVKLQCPQKNLQAMVYSS